MRGLALRFDKSDDGSWLGRLKVAQQMGFEDFVACVAAPTVPVAKILETAAAAGSRIRALRFSEPFSGAVNPDQPGFAKLASPDSSVRRRSLDTILETLRSLGRSSLRTLVIDAGLVAFPGGKQLATTIKAQAEDSREDLAKLLERASKERASRVGDHLEALVRSMFEIEQACEGLRVAIVTPDSPLGVCLPDELDLALSERPKAQRAYWHETCAAKALERLGVVAQDVWLDRFGSKMVGVMLSDSIGGEGGQAPGLGEVDFKRVKPYLTTETARIMNVGDDRSGFKLQFGRDHLTEVGIF